MIRRGVLIGTTAVILVPSAASASVPYPTPTRRQNPYRYETYAFIDPGTGDCTSGTNPEEGPRDLPENFDCSGDWKFTNYAARPGDPDFDPAVAANPAELGGVKGSSVNLAWEITTGRPDTVIAVMDSGIRWDGRDSVTGEISEGEVNELSGLRKKFFLNRKELPRPGPAGCRRPGFGGYDRNCDGVFNVVDYEKAAGCKTRCVADANGNSLVDPEDLILTYSDTRDDDGNGYTDDISGWDFFENDNDPNDDVDYGHGTGESEDSGFEAEATAPDGTLLAEDGMCPNCMLMEMRVGDSFIADVNHWAEAVVYATDNGVSVVQEALGTLNNSSFGQAAADYAYARGVVIVASAADESAAHHNYPSNYDHTMVVNSVTRFNDVENDQGQMPKSYLYFNGCTNFGGHIHVAIASSSCSSEATGRGAGYAGLLYSAARNAVARGQIGRYRRDDGSTAPYPLSAQEVMQIFRLGAEDIDFSPPHSIAPWLTAHVVPSRRYQTVPGWDMFFGYGRLNVYRMLAAAGFDRAERGLLPNMIPPEADITAPSWFAPLSAEGSVVIRGRVAANRSKGYDYAVEWAPGAQPPLVGDEWTTVAQGSRDRALRGTLATLDMAEVAAAVARTGPLVFDPLTDPTSPALPEKDAFRVRVRVEDADGNVASFQKQFFVFSDPDLFAGFPRRLGSDGAGSPAFANLDSDPADELVLSTSDGLVHVFNTDGSEVRGWPRHTDAISLPRTGANAYGRGFIHPGRVFGPILLGSPTVADIVANGRGRVEIAVADLEGKLYLWDEQGRPMRGFPVSVVRRYSEEPGCEEGGAPRCDDFLGPRGDRRDAANAVDHGFHHSPVAADIDPRYKGLELIAGAGDNHVYAWHADGTPVRGWPVLLRDPEKIDAISPMTHKVTFKEDAGNYAGSKILVSPSIGDVDGDGDLDVVAAINEEYAEAPNASRLREQLSGLPVTLTDVGNGRVYAFAATGNYTGSETDDPGHPSDQSYLPGWPARIATIAAELLPYVGEGPDGAPVLADVDGDDQLEIGVAMHAGPGYIFDSDGTSHFGTDPEGRAVTLASDPLEFKGAAKDGPAFVAVGGGSFGELLPGRVMWAAPSAGLLRLLDVALAEQQLGAEDQVAAWDAATGTFAPGFPTVVNDLQFFAVPSIADVSGDGVPEVIEGTAVYDLAAVNALLIDVPGWPKFTGGWIVSAPGTGDFDGNGALDVAAVTREGWLFVWATEGDACQAPQWPKYQHDLANTGNLESPVTPPASCL